MASADLIRAVALGLRPPQIVGVAAIAKAAVNHLIATNQLADEKALKALYAANLLQSPNSVNLFV